MAKTEISNKFLVFLLVIAILVTIIGTWYSLERVSKLAAITGYSGKGYINVTIEGKVALNVTQPYCGFGTGYVTPGYNFAELASEGGDCAIGAGEIKHNWTNTTSYDPKCMTVKNTGNTYVKVNVSSNKNASTMIGGANPSVKVWSDNPGITILGCLDGVISYANKVEINKTNVTVCKNLSKVVDENTFFVGCYLKIPKDAPAEQKTAEWTFTGVAV